MTEQDYLVLLLAEEAAEVVHRASKAIRFGLDEIQRDHIDNNLVRLLHELNDLAAVAYLFQEDWMDEQLIEAKKAKVERYMNYSRFLGRLEEVDANN